MQEETERTAVMQHLIAEACSDERTSAPFGVWHLKDDDGAILVALLAKGIARRERLRHVIEQHFALFELLVGEWTRLETGACYAIVDVSKWPSTSRKFASGMCLGFLEEAFNQEESSWNRLQGFMGIEWSG